MTKTLGIIICSAFSVGLVAETAAGVWSLANGQGISLATAIELIIAWLVVLAVFVYAIISGFRGRPRWQCIGVVVHRTPDPDDDTDDSDSSDDDDGSDSDDDGSDDSDDDGSDDSESSDSSDGTNATDERE